MTLIGEYTQAGAQLAAQIQSGQADLSITRAAAGSGRTATGATAMASERQALAIQGHTVSGSTLTVPARLLSVEAAEAYTLSEIGLFAQDAQGEEILYKLFRFDQGIAVSPTCSLSATFYLNDTVVSGSTVLAAVSPTGMLTQDDAETIKAETIERIGSLVDEDIAISCAGEDLQSTLDALPKLIAQRITISVTSSPYTGDLRIWGFYGPGRLNIVGTSQRQITGSLSIVGCRLGALGLDNFYVGTLQPDSFPINPNVDGYRSCTLAVLDCSGVVTLRRCPLKPGTAKSGNVGYYIRGSRVTLSGFWPTTRAVGIMGSKSAHITLRSYNSGYPGAFNIDYVLKLYNGSTLVWPTSLTSMSTITGTSAYTLEGGSSLLYPNAMTVASGWSETDY